MKFKKFTNLLFLVLCWILSFILLYVFLVLDDSNFNIISYYLIASSISVIVYVIVSLIKKHIIKSWKCSLGTIKKCEYSFLSNCDLTYSFECDGKIVQSVYHYSQLEKVGKQEYIYISKNNNKLYRERDITLFSNKLMYMLLVVSLLLFIFAFYINNIEIFDNFLWKDLTISEIFGYLCVIKFVNLFPFFGLFILISIVNLSKKEGMAVDARVVDVYIQNCSEFDEIGGINTTRHYQMGTPKYEYILNGKSQIYISKSSSTNIPKIGKIKKLYIDNEGMVVKE